MSIQRVVTVQLDRSASRLGQLLTGSVPIVGQALSSAADAVLAGMQLLKSTLGIAALLSIGAEFAPLVSRAADTSAFSVLLRLACRDRRAGALP